MGTLLKMFAVGVAFTLAGTAFGQAKEAAAAKKAEKAPPVRQMTVSVGSTVRVQMTTKRPIQKVFNENETILRVTPVTDDPTTVMVTGLRPGITRIHLTDIDGKTEVIGPRRQKDK